MKFIIVDDEELIRYSVRNMLESLSDKNTVVEVNSGQALLDKLGQFRPEIVFIDIKMPGMDGLEAMRRGKALSPETQWVVLSGFSEFEYAQKSIQYGVLDYLIKPVDSDALKHVIEKAHLEISKTKKDIVRDFKNEILSLLSDYNILPSETEQDMLFMYEAFVLKLDAAEQDEISNIVKEAMLRDIDVMVENAVHDGIPVFWVKTNPQEYLIVWRYRKERQDTSFIFSHIMKKFRECRDAYCSETLQVTCFYVKKCATKLLLIKHIRQIQHLLYLRILIGVGREISIVKLAEVVYQSDKNLLGFAENMELFVEGLRDNRYMDSYFALERLQKYWVKAEGMMQAYSEPVRRYLYCNTGKCMVLSEQDGRWAEKLSVLLGSISSKENPEDGGTSIIDKIKSYIDVHYREEISVKDLAARFYITPNYLSALFKKETDSTLSRYVMKLRMVEAKHLLETTNLTIQEICERVGYQSARHFTKNFLSYFNCYPSDIRKNRR